MENVRFKLSLKESMQRKGKSIRKNRRPKSTESAWETEISLEPRENQGEWAEITLEVGGGLLSEMSEYTRFETNVFSITKLFL